MSWRRNEHRLCNGCIICNPKARQHPRIRVCLKYEVCDLQDPQQGDYSKKSLWYCRWICKAMALFRYERTPWRPILQALTHADSSIEVNGTAHLSKILHDPAHATGTRTSVTGQQAGQFPWAPCHRGTHEAKLLQTYRVTVGKCNRVLK